MIELWCYGKETSVHNNPLLSGVGWSGVGQLAIVPVGTRWADPPQHLYRWVLKKLNAPIVIF